MLAGIGGRTVAEAKQRLTYREFVAWAAYRKKHGNLTVQHRQEVVAANNLAIIATKPGNRLDTEKFMLFSRPSNEEWFDEDAEESSIDDAFALIDTLATANDKLTGK